MQNSVFPVAAFVLLAAWTEHAQIMRMIAEHDAEGAQALVRAHLQQAARNVELALPETGAPATAAGGHAPVAQR